MYTFIFILLLLGVYGHIMTADFGVIGQFGPEPHIAQFDLSQNPIKLIYDVVVPNNLDQQRAGYYRGAYNPKSQVFFFYYNIDSVGLPGTIATYNLATKTITPALKTPSEFSGFVDVEVDRTLDVAVLSTENLKTGNYSYWIYDYKKSTITLKSSIIVPAVECTQTVALDFNNHILYHPLVPTGKEELVGFIIVNIQNGAIRKVDVSNDRFFDSVAFNPTANNVIGLLFPPIDNPDNKTILGVYNPLKGTLSTIGAEGSLYTTFNASPAAVSPDGNQYVVVGSLTPDIQHLLAVTYDVQTGVRTENALPPLTGQPNFPWSFVELE